MPEQARKHCLSESSPISHDAEGVPQRNNPETFEDIIQKRGASIRATCGRGPAEDRQKCPPCPPATSLFRQPRSPSSSGSPKPAAKGPAKPERLTACIR